MRLSRAAWPLGRYLPFVVVVLLAELSALWPPGPSDRSAYALSALLLVLCGVLGRVERSLSVHTWVLRAAVYISSVVCLMLATGGVNSGLGGLLFVPVVGVALYGRRWESAAVVAGVLAALVAVSLLGPHSVAGAIPRRLVFTGSIVAMISVGIHSLRRQLNRSNERTMRLLQNEEAINAAARQLVLLSEPSQITSLCVRLATQVALPSESSEQSAAYLRIIDGIVVSNTSEEDSHANVAECWPLIEHPGLREAVASRQPVTATLNPDDAGPGLRMALAKAGVTHGAWVPVCPDGELHGVLSVGSRGAPIPRECFERCVALGHFLELALSNWAAHEKLKEQATAEERRRIARELHDGLAHELAFIASKTRGDVVPGPASPDVRALAGAADRALDEARRAITVLSVSRQQSLHDAIAQTAEDLGARLGVAVDLELAEEFDVPGDVTENLLRIVREAVTNAVTHGSPGRVRVTLESANGMRLLIEDDGCGFDPYRDMAPEAFGLQSMRERAELLGATFNLDSAPRRGTRVEVVCS